MAFRRKEFYFGLTDAEGSAAPAERLPFKMPRYDIVQTRAAFNCERRSSKSYLRELSGKNAVARGVGCGTTFPHRQFAASGFFETYVWNYRQSYRITHSRI